MANNDSGKSGGFAAYLTYLVLNYGAEYSKFLVDAKALRSPCSSQSSVQPVDDIMA